MARQKNKLALIISSQTPFMDQTTWVPQKWINNDKHGMFHHTYWLNMIIYAILWFYIFSKIIIPLVGTKKVAVAPMLEGWMTHCRPRNASTVARDRRSQQKKQCFLVPLHFQVGNHIVSYIIVVRLFFIQ